MSPMPSPVPLSVRGCWIPFALGALLFGSSACADHPDRSPTGDLSVAHGGSGSSQGGGSSGTGATGPGAGSPGYGGGWTGEGCPVASGPADLANQVFGKETYSVDYFAKPAKGESFIDATFNTRITRITDANTDGYGDRMMRPFYAKHDHENADGSLVMLHDGGHWHLFETGSWSYVRQLPDEVAGWAEPRWDATDPSVFYFVAGMTFNRYEVRDGGDDVFAVVRDFAQDYPTGSKIWNEHEGESDMHSRNWVFKVVGAAATGTKIISYDRLADRIVGKIDSPSDPNWVSVSPSGEHVVLGVSPFEAWDLGFTTSVTLPPGASGHADLALAADGRDAICYHNHSHDWYSFSYLDTGEEVRVFPIEEWSFSGEHFSGNNYATPGWCAVSTFASTSAEGWGWQPSYWLDGALFLMELTADNPRLYRLSHPRTAREGYWSGPLASINRCGTRLYWGGNWSDPNGAIDTYVVDLPIGWWEALSGTASP